MLALSALSATAGSAAAADPTTDNVSALGDLTKTCATKLSGSYAFDDGGSEKVYICGDKKDAIYWTADMDIDCDGASTSTCNTTTDPWFQVGTSFGNNIDASKVPYYVIPSNFNLGSHGLDGGQIAAVLYNGKLTFAVLMDTGPNTIIGEASYATAKLLGVDPDPETGGTDGPVTYIVFTGASGRVANLSDHAEALTKGKTLADKFIADNGGSTGLASRARASEAFHLSRNALTVDSRGPHTVRMLDSRGRTVLTRSAQGPARYDLSGFPAGAYLIRASAGTAALNTSILF